MKKFFVTLVAIGLLSPVIASVSCRGGYSGPVESISIGSSPSEVNSLITIAQEQGYFADNGVSVDFKTYPSGAAALDDVLNRGVDFAIGSEFAFARKVLSGENVRTIANICRSSTEYLVARTDNGIRELSDLKGKRIGVPLGSRPQFALDRFFVLSGIADSDATLVDVPVDRSVDALVSGEVDAVAAWQPYIARIQEQMGVGVVVWDVQANQPSYTLIMCTADWLTAHPALAERFLESLVQAEDYLAENQQAAMALIQNSLDYDDAYMISIWLDLNFSVTLEQSLIAAMEDEARWLMSEGLTTATQTPNFLDYIYTDALQSVQPESVNLIR